MGVTPFPLPGAPRRDIRTAPSQRLDPRDPRTWAHGGLVGQDRPAQRDAAAAGRAEWQRSDAALTGLRQPCDILEGLRRSRCCMERGCVSTTIVSDRYFSINSRT